MMKNWIPKTIISVLAFPVLFYIGWVANDTPGNSSVSGHKFIQPEIRQNGYDRYLGNVVLISPSEQSLNFGSIRQTYIQMESWIKEASVRGWLKNNTILVLPGRIADQFIRINARAEMLHSDSWENASGIYCLSHPISWVLSKLKAPGLNLQDRSLLISSEERLAQMQRIFGNLSRTYHISILLAGARLPVLVLKNEELNIAGPESLDSQFILWDSAGHVLQTGKVGTESLESIPLSLGNKMWIADGKSLSSRNSSFWSENSVDRILFVSEGQPSLDSSYWRDASFETGLLISNSDTDWKLRVDAVSSVLSKTRYGEVLSVQSPKGILLNHWL